ncbi:hypothetical protein Geob_3543 [Geotalea daltonii FRC-32]|uniref:6-phosphogluconate dehydrogenase n=2 Tax=Geotalea TaxID=2910589 RepID=B9M696_GEODF|nr:hypothetical protein [Geotalea daltonii]ACM21884.1 hypothetical protein Geob_3543 [Geotalea daltonii FRC-32]
MGIKGSKIALWVSAVMLLLIGCFFAYTWFALTWSYSSGERAGYIQKFSRKGWLCKTWEGELSMVPVPGAVPEKFLFSVREEAVAQKITSSMGKRVSLVYEQHKGVPTSCFGESEYYVTAVKITE